MFCLFHIYNSLMLVHPNNTVFEEEEGRGGEEEEEKKKRNISCSTSQLQMVLKF